MPTETENSVGKIGRIGKILRATANKRRLLILSFLKTKGQVSVSEIARHIHLSVRSTSRHLAVLSSAEIVEKEQRGLFMFYKISSNVHVCAQQIINIL